MTKPYGKLKKDLDAVFSRFIRARDKGVCFTCGLTKEWKYQQAGHCFTRSRMNTRWNEKQVRCQCYGCNICRGGNGAEFACRLDKKYGKGTAEKIRKESLIDKRFTTAELEKLIIKYQAKLEKELDKQSKE